MSADKSRDTESNRLTRRVRRYAKVSANVGAIAARFAGQQFFGLDVDRGKNAAELAAALGGLKGPLMKVAQLLATIPDALPPEYTEQLATLQNQAPPMGWAFVRRRMAAELGADWQAKFNEFEHEAAASASLGQVHKALGHDGAELACKLQYADMESAVAADLNQLSLVLAVHRRMDPAIDTREIEKEIGARIREELDYILEAGHMRLYRAMLAPVREIRVPRVHEALSTRRLLTMDWMEGRPLLEFRDHSLEERNLIGAAMFRAWWQPFTQYGVIHGDPHLGNYTVFTDEKGSPGGINLLDYGCIRKFNPGFVKGVIDLYHGLLNGDRDLVVSAYESWGFENLTNELIDILNIWAEFICGPILDDRVRTVADGVRPGEYGRREVFQVHQALKEKGPVTPPREFVFMDRAAIGLGGVFLHLNAEMNLHTLFNELIEDFSLETLEAQQKAAFAAAGMPPAAS